MYYSVSDMALATGGTVLGPGQGGVSGVSTDSRTVLPGELFVALRGAKFDGHDFIAAAAGRGVTHFLVQADYISRVPIGEGRVFIGVADTLKGLADLAAFHRRRHHIPVVAVTGSNGKTTTKEMLATILESSGPGLKTSGNRNNLIGLPLMLLQLTDEHRWAVLEMGMSEFGEIDRLAEIAAPGVGIITNAFPAHLATLGSLAGVARAKGELFLRLPAGATAIYNADDPLISACPVPAGVNRIGFGLHGAEVMATDIQILGLEGQSFRLHLGGGSQLVKLKAFGLHNVSNALAAAAAASVLGVTLDQIAKGLAAFTPYDRRFRLEQLGPVVLIDDSYNANPASVGTALLTLLELKGAKRAIAVLGDMLELGEESREAHRDVGRLAATCVDRLYLYGEMALVTAAAAREAGLPPAEVIVAASHSEILADIVKDHIDGDFILVKGSRGMAMDRVTSALRETFSQSAYQRRAD